MQSDQEERSSFAFRDSESSPESGAYMLVQPVRQLIMIIGTKPISPLYAKSQSLRIGQLGISSRV